MESLRPQIPSIPLKPLGASDTASNKPNPLGNLAVKELLQQSPATQNPGHKKSRTFSVFTPGRSEQQPIELGSLTHKEDAPAPFEPKPVPSPPPRAPRRPFNELIKAIIVTIKEAILSFKKANTDSLITREIISLEPIVPPPPRKNLSEKIIDLVTSWIRGETLLEAANTLVPIDLYFDTASNNIPGPSSFLAYPFNFPSSLNLPAQFPSEVPELGITFLLWNPNLLVPSPAEPTV